MSEARLHISRQLDILHFQTQSVHRRAMELAMRGDSEKVTKKVAEAAREQAALFKEMGELGKRLNQF